MRLLLAAAAWMLFALPAHAQTSAPPSPTAQALTACVSRSTTDADNVVLVRWMFVAIARHPTVTGLATIPDAERVNANRQMAAVFNRLLLVSCREETRAAFAADSANALYAPFSAFGERAMGTIMSHPDVNAGIAEMSSYIDREGLAAIMPAQ